MPWTVEQSDRCVRNGITGAEYSKYTEFTNCIRQGTHPRTASENMGHLGYENLGGSLYSIRLSGGGRLYFEVDEGNEHVLVTQVGGHR